jgi:arginase family enzyme
LRRIETTASADELRWFHTEFMRLLFRVDMDVTQRTMATEMGANMPGGVTEEEIERAAVEWTSGLAK